LLSFCLGVKLAPSLSWKQLASDLGRDGSVVGRHGSGRVGRGGGLRQRNLSLPRWHQVRQAPSCARAVSLVDVLFCILYFL
jgi:hypothetical protein